MTEHGGELAAEGGRAPMSTAQKPGNDQDDDRIDLGTFGRAVRYLFLAEFVLSLGVCVIYAPTLWPLVVILGFVWLLWRSMIQ